MRIYKDFAFEAAHKLDHVPAGHKCARLHGHSYRVRVWVGGMPDPVLGWVADFADIKAAVRPVIERLDHAYLNDVAGMGQSTAENIAIWLWRQIKPGLAGLCRVEVRETSTSGAVYEGEHEPS